MRSSTSKLLSCFDSGCSKRVLDVNSQPNAVCKIVSANESQTAEITADSPKTMAKARSGQSLAPYQAETKHAIFWTKFLKDRGIDTAGAKISKLRIMPFMLVFRLFGVGLGLKLLEKGEQAAIGSYGLILGNGAISQQEKTTIKEILADELGHEDEFEEYGKRYKFFVDSIAVILTQVSGGLVTVLTVAAGLSGVYNQPYVAALAGMLVGLTQAANSAREFLLLRQN